MSKSGCSAIECVCVTPLILTLQKTWASSYCPFVRFRNLNIITFCAGGMLLASQKPGGAVDVGVGLSGVVGVGVRVGVRVAVRVGVRVALGVGVRVAVRVAPGSGVGVGVTVGTSV